MMKQLDLPVPSATIFEQLGPFPTSFRGNPPFCDIVQMTPPALAGEIRLSSSAAPADFQPLPQGRLLKVIMAPSLGAGLILRWADSSDANALARALGGSGHEYLFRMGDHFVHDAARSGYIEVRGAAINVGS